MKNLILAILLVVTSLGIVSRAEAQWLPAVRLTNADYYKRLSYNNAKCIVAKGSYIVVAWADERDGKSEIYCKRSTDRGATWSEDRRMTIFNGWSMEAAMACDGSTLHLTWSDLRTGAEGIYYRRSTDMGVSWGPETAVMLSMHYVYAPSITALNSNVYIACTQNSAPDRQVYFIKSLNGGVNWGTPTLLADPPGESKAELGSISASEGLLHVAYQSDQNGRPEIYYRRSLDQGVTWSTAVALTADGYDSFMPSLSAFGAGVHMVCRDYSSQAVAKVRYKRSIDYGQTWQDDLVFFETRSVTFPVITAASLNSIQTAWGDYRNGGYDIYLRSSMDGGFSWLPELNLSGTVSLSAMPQPSMAIADSGVYVIWLNYWQHTNPEIYFKRNLNGNPTGVHQTSLEIPHSYELKQNYPNPFNPMTTIEFSVPKASNIRISIIDITGREIAVVVNEVKGAGTYAVGFNAVSLNSGIYFYRLKSENFTETKKMIVLK